MDNSNNQPQQPRKKPWYKRWWAICLYILIALSIISSVSGGGDKGDSSSDSSSTSSAKTSGKSSSAKPIESKSSSSADDDALNKTYNVGDTITYKGYQIKVNKVTWSQGNDVDKPDQGKQYCIVNVTLKNVGAADKWDYNPFDFKLNDDGNNTDLDEIVTDDNINQLQAGSLDKGATVTGDLVGQANPNAGKLQLQYQASIWDNNKTLNINLK